jgi:NADH-quinone oxidoreductase subunit J
MSSQEIAFVIIGTIGSLAAIRLVTSQNVVHAALYLVVTLSVIAGTYLLVAAEFLTWVQVIIYVGAIVVLLLFSLMLTKAPIGRETLDNQQRGWALLVGIGVLAGLVYLIQDAFGDSPAVRFNVSRTSQIGAVIFRDWVLPFEVVSILLLAALIGAVVIARRDEPGANGSARPLPPVAQRAPERRPEPVAPDPGEEVRA